MDLFIVKKFMLTLLVASALLAGGGHAIPEADCNRSVPPYPDGSAYGANVATILEGLVISTPNAAKLEFVMHLTFPDVYGKATCSSGEDCSDCLRRSKDMLVSTCGNAVAGWAGESSCRLEYGPTEV